MNYIKNKDDFDVTVEVLDDDGVQIDLSLYDFKIEHFTKDTLVHTASSLDGEQINCDITDGKAVCHIDSFDFELTDTLKERVTIYFPNAEFEDELQQSTSQITLDAVII